MFIPRVHRLLLCVRSPVCDLGFFFSFVLASLRSFLFLLLFLWRCFQFPVPHSVADTSQKWRWWFVVVIFLCLLSSLLHTSCSVLVSFGDV